MDRFGLPRTTLFYWVRDLPIARANNGRTFPQRLGNEAMQRKYRLLREEAYAQGRNEFAELAADPTFRDFVCMYIGEGYKRSRNSVSLANSDPTVILLATTWIRRFARTPAKYSVQYHADQDVIELRSFWGDLLGISGGEIRVQRKSNSGQLSSRQWRCRYGVFSVGAHDTLLRARLGAWMDCLFEEWRGLDSADSGRGAAW